MTALVFPQPSLDGDYLHHVIPQSDGEDGDRWHSEEGVEIDELPNHWDSNEVFIEQRLHGTRWRDAISGGSTECEEGKQTQEA